IMRQLDKRLVGADVGSRLLTTNVLLAGSESKNEAALTVLVGGLTDQTSWHLADVLFASGDPPAVWSTESKRHAERLCFHGNDIRLARRLHDAQRNCFRDGNYQHRSLFVGDLGDGGQVLIG